VPGFFYGVERNQRFFLIITIFILAQSATASVDTVTVAGSVISAKAIVVTPADMDSDVLYPVVYLLHGWSGNYRNWYDKANLADLADRYRFILVCPDGGYAGWYLDSPLDSASQYATYISQEVVDFIDARYPTIATKEGRFITGLSMGGHGAVSLLARYPGHFDAAGSMSGVMVLADVRNKYGLVKLIGVPDSTAASWSEYSCINLVERLSGTDVGLLIDCGIADFTIDGNRRMHQRLMELEIPHEYYERPGSHSWKYWVNALESHLLFFRKRLE
jgi:putative tributyrin esterase